MRTSFEIFSNDHRGKCFISLLSNPLTNFYYEMLNISNVRDQPLKETVFSFNNQRRLPFGFGCTPHLFLSETVFLFNQIQYDLVHKDVHHTITIPIEKCFSDRHLQDIAGCGLMV